MLIETFMGLENKPRGGCLIKKQDLLYVLKMFKHKQNNITNLGNNHFSHLERYS